MVAEGDAYNRVLVDRLQDQHPARSGFFKDVDISQQPGSAPDKTVLRVKVTEQPTGELSFSLGYSSVDQLVADIGISERNFRGRGQQLTLRVEAGYLQQQISAGFTEPRFLGRNLSGGFNVYAQKTDLDYSKYTSYRTSLGRRRSFSLGFPLTEGATFSRLAGSYLDPLRSEAFVDDLALRPGPIPRASRSPLRPAGQLRHLVGRLQLPGRPARRPGQGVDPGYRCSSASQESRRCVGGTVKYVKSTVDLQLRTTGFTPNIVLKLEGPRPATSSPWGNDYVRINDRLLSSGRRQLPRLRDRGHRPPRHPVRRRARR